MELFVHQYNNSAADATVEALSALSDAEELRHLRRGSGGIVHVRAHVCVSVFVYVCPRGCLCLCVCMWGTQEFARYFFGWVRPPLPPPRS